jgi:hypothetical protein
VKTLRKGDEFKRVPDSNKKDYVAIQRLVDAGWRFCDKTTWREHRKEKESG